ncbi:MAG: hypothetical protein ACYCOU_01970 [Sulfobacillus sp.]
MRGPDTEHHHIHGEIDLLFVSNPISGVDAALVGVGVVNVDTNEIIFDGAATVNSSTVSKVEFSVPPSVKHWVLVYVPVQTSGLPLPANAQIFATLYHVSDGRRDPSLTFRSAQFSSIVLSPATAAGNQTASNPFRHIFATSHRTELN